MGTALYARGLLYNGCLDAATVDRAAVVRSVHEAYLKAGASVLTTNTFGAHAWRLEAHDATRRVVELNRAAARLARDVGGEQTWVAGSVGPSGRVFLSLSAAEQLALSEVLSEQARALCEEGVDLLLLETFQQPGELLLALRSVKQTVANTPVVVSMSVDRQGALADGSTPLEWGKRLIDAGADALGINCSDGPATVYGAAVPLLELGVPVVARPNAGLPRRIEGRLAYLTTPEYFGLYSRRLFKAGVHAVGGCCGTDYEHVRAIAAAARMVGTRPGPAEAGKERSKVAAVAAEVGSRPESASPEKRAFPQHPFAQALTRGFVVSVEVNPPAGLDLAPALDAARLLRDGGITAINVADGPRASARMGNLALCHRIEQTLGMPALMHVTTRDRNVLGLVAHLLAAHELGLRNAVVITGDPPKMGDFPAATAVYDLDSIGLLRLVKGLNCGYDPGGKSLGFQTDFLCATGAEPAAVDYERELRRLDAKVEAGADLIMTQPVYDPVVLERFLRDTQSLQVPVLVGLLPLASYRNAEFLHNEVPGMRIPDEVRERMRKAGRGPAARAEGVRIAREMLDAVGDRVQGAYIMPPLGRYALALEVVEGRLRALRVASTAAAIDSAASDSPASGFSATDEPAAGQGAAPSASASSMGIKAAAAASPRCL